MVYLFIGQDSLSKDIKLKAIKQEFLSQKTAHFNSDILYGRGLTLRDLQEKLIYLPVKSPLRILIIKEAQSLREELKEFILKYVLAPYKKIILVLDIERFDKKDEFINNLCRYVKVLRFRETVQPDAFALSRQIEFKKPDSALKILSQLIKDGERPERILGGLRYCVEKGAGTPQEARRKFQLLLNCDIDIKTGRLKPVFALEKLVVGLCGFGKPSG